MNFLVLIILVIIITGCQSVGYWDGPNGRKCRASCSTLADNGKSCVEWSDNVSRACVGEYSEVYQCCTNQGNCPINFGQAYKGLRCTCQFQTPYGPRVIPGQGCE